MLLTRLQPSARAGLAMRNQRLSRVWTRLKQERSGSVTLEFALLLPILALLMIGSAEIYSYSAATSRVEDAARTVGDLTASNASVDEQRMSAVFNAAKAMMEANSSGDHSSQPAEMTISSLLACPCSGGGKKSNEYCYTVLWSHKYINFQLADGYPQGASSDILPKELAQEAGDTFLVSELTYKYSPKIKLILDDAAMHFNKKIIFRPRQTERVSHTGQQALDPEPSCSNAGNNGRNNNNNDDDDDDDDDDEKSYDLGRKSL